MTTNQSELASGLIPLLLEAEDLVLSNYQAHSLSDASDGEVIKVFGDGTASTIFNYAAGQYDVVVGYVDEDDGVSQLEVWLGNTLLDSWFLDAQFSSNTYQFFQRTVATNLSLEAGNQLEIKGTQNGGEYARLDFLQFIPTEENNSLNSTPESPPTPPTPPPAPNSLIPEPTPLLIEAEELVLSNYQAHSLDDASGGEVIKVYGSGTASTIFNSTTGQYDVVVGYVDESDGVSQLEVWLGNTLLDSWFLDAQLDNDSHQFLQRTVATNLSLEAGNQLEIKGTQNGGEYARLDFLKFIPTGESDTPITPSPDNGIVVDLNSPQQPIKIMPFGDSITQGIYASQVTLDDEGGYRDYLWDQFQQLGLEVDFVGSLSSGPSGFDNNHNGYGGRTIDWLASDNWSSKGGHPQGLTGSLQQEQPDIMLVMAGTNDTKHDSVSQMVNDLNNLIGKITDLSPDTAVLIASIPPILSDAQSASRAQKAQDFNEAIPGVVNNWESQGKKVDFVDMRSLTINELSLPDVDNGLHPNDQGYSKIANFWYEAVLDVINTEQILNIPIEAIASEFNDQLIGNEFNNSLTGGLGYDTLTGGGGSDRFIYNSPNQGLDTITDFSADDLFQISASGFGGGLQANVSLSDTDSPTGTLIVDSNPLAVGSSANFLYNTTTSILSFDADGAGIGEAIDLASLVGSPFLSVEQLVLGI